MKRILLTLAIIAFASVGMAGVPMEIDQKSISMKNDMTWTNDTTAYVDTLTCTGTLQYSKPFQSPNGYITFFGKCKFSSTGADTDTVQIYLYNSPRSTTNALRWIKIDSCSWGGRADTLFKGYNFDVGAAFGIWWRLGFRKLMGVPKLIDKSRNSQ